jgi:rod shape determining protein RodA
MRRRFVPDFTLLALALVLSVYGIAMVYSAGQTDVLTRVTTLWQRQALWFSFGLIAAYAMSRTSLRVVDWITPPLYAATCVLLLLLVFIGKGFGTGASTKSWLAIGGYRLGQPSEFAKIVVVLMLAKILAARRDAPKSLIDLWQPAVIVGIPWLLIMAQPDLGTGLVFIGIFFAMLFWSGCSWYLLLFAASPGISLVLAFNTTMWGAWFVFLIIVAIWKRLYFWEAAFVIVASFAMGVVAPLVWEKLNPYQQKRLLVFIDPGSDPLRSGYHVIQSQVAIGSGGWLGKGFTMGTQKRLAFLPAQHTDFIFPVVGEELGFVGVTIALGLFLWLFLRCVRVAGRATDSFSSLVAFGLVATWFVHVLVNIGMTLNLVPVTGIPLPFFSYGGSFMLACWIGVGMEMRISGEGRGTADTLVI